MKRRSDTKKSSGKYSWDAISALMQKTTGVGFSYENFLQAHDTIPAIAGIVSDFNEHGLILSGDGDEPEEQPDGTDSIESSAKIAAKNKLNSDF